MAQKCTWHGNEEQRDNDVYDMLQSYGVQARNYLRTGKINLTYQASKQLFKLANIFDVTIPQRMNYFSMFKCMSWPAQEYKHLEDFNYYPDGLAMGGS